MLDDHLHTILDDHLHTIIDDHPPMPLKKKMNQVGQEEDSKPAKRRRGRNNSATTTTSTSTTSTTTTSATPSTTPSTIRSTNPDNTIMNIEKDFMIYHSKLNDVDNDDHNAKEEGNNSSGGGDDDIARAIKSNPLQMIYLINAHSIVGTSNLSLYSCHDMMMDILSQSLYNRTESMMTTQCSVDVLPLGKTNDNYTDTRASNCDKRVSGSDKWVSNVDKKAFIIDKRTSNGNKKSSNDDKSSSSVTTKYQNSDQFVKIVDNNNSDDTMYNKSSSDISSSSISIAVLEKKRLALSNDGSTPHQNKKPSTTAVAWTCIQCTFYNTKSSYPYFCEVCCYDRRVANRSITITRRQENDTANAINDNGSVIIDLVSDDEDKHYGNNHHKTYDQNSNININNDNDITNNNNDGDDGDDGDDAMRFQRYMNSSRDRLMHQLEAIVTYRHTLLNSMNMDTKIVSSLAWHLNIPSSNSYDGVEASRRHYSSSNDNDNTSLELELLLIKDRTFAHHHASHHHHHIMPTIKSSPSSQSSSPFISNSQSFISSLQHCIKSESNFYQHININQYHENSYFQFTKIIPEPSIVIMQGRRFGNPQRKGKSQFWGNRQIIIIMFCICMCRYNGLHRQQSINK